MAIGKPQPNDDSISILITGKTVTGLQQGGNEKETAKQLKNERQNLLVHEFRHLKQLKKIIIANRKNQV